MNRFTCILLMALSSYLLASQTSSAFERYKNDDKDDGSNCSECHGDFTDDTTTKGTTFPDGNKHVMHGRENTYMDADCDLCHLNGDSRNPYIDRSDGTANNPGLGCNGCHLALGLRRHHAANGITDCADCHPGEGNLTLPPEDTIPPYYGTEDTLANGPCNDVLASNTNENWSIGDFIGLDNDGNSLYDLADFACGPPYQIVDIAIEGADARVTWETVGGRTDVLRSASAVDGTYSDVGSAVTIPGVGLATTNRLEVGGASASPLRAYQVKSVP